MKKEDFVELFLPKVNDILCDYRSKMVTELLFEMMNSFFNQQKIPEKNGSEAKQVLESYYMAYIARYKTKITVTPRMVIYCKRLVSLLGVESAIEVAAYYVGKNTSFYIQRRHELSLCLKDAESLALEVAQLKQAGKLVGVASAKNISVMEENYGEINTYMDEKRRSGAV